MRVLLYDSQLSRYFKAAGSWTQDACQALDFQDTVRAVNAALQEKLKSVEIILDFGDAYLGNMHLPLTIPS